MKKLAFLLTMTTGVVFISAQKIQQKDIPALVQKGFQKQFPAVKDAKWENEDGKYEAGFKYKGEEMSVLYNAQGVWEEKETEIKVSQLPAMASSYVAKKQLGKIQEASKITKADGSVMYEAEVKSGDVLFDAKGNFVKLAKE